VDDLYRFIHAWVPNLYGELDENYWREHGYILFDTDTDLSPELSPHESAESADSTEEGKARDEQGDEITDLTRESWEVSAAACLHSIANELSIGRWRGELAAKRNFLNLRLTLRLRQLFHTQISSHWFFCIS
jgi:hypothetical protein